MGGKIYDRPVQRILLLCAAFLTLFASCNYVTPVGEVEDMLGVKLRGKNAGEGGLGPLPRGPGVHTKKSC